MPIPDYQAFMLPMLRFLSDGRERTIREVAAGLADHFSLTEQEREERLPSGKQSVVNNRVGWAKSYLKFAGLVDNPLIYRSLTGQAACCRFGNRRAGDGDHKT